MCRKGCIPKTFCNYPLQYGALTVGLIMCVILMFCVFASVVQVFLFKKCVSCPENTSKNVFALCITAACYCVFMLILSLWFIWGVKKEKKSVVIAYLVVGLLWWTEALCHLFVLIFVYRNDSSIIWLTGMFCIFVAMCILLYGFLIIYAYWKELRARALQPPTQKT